MSGRYFLHDRGVKTLLLVLNRLLADTCKLRSVHGTLEPRWVAQTIIFSSVVFTVDGSASFTSFVRLDLGCLFFWKAMPVYFHGHSSLGANDITSCPYMYLLQHKMGDLDINKDKLDLLRTLSRDTSARSGSTIR